MVLTSYVALTTTPRHVVLARGQFVPSREGPKLQFGLSRGGPALQFVPSREKTFTAVCAVTRNT